MSVATIMIAVVFAIFTTLTVGYRTGRAHSAWLNVRAARREVPVRRRAAWSQTRGLLVVGLVLFGALFVAAWNAGH